MSTQLRRDDRAWAMVAPFTMPHMPDWVAQGFTVLAGQPRPYPDVECPRCHFDALLMVPIAARREHPTGVAHAVLRPVFVCARCWNDQIERQ